MLFLKIKRLFFRLCLNRDTVLFGDWAKQRLIPPTCVFGSSTERKGLRHWVHVSTGNEKQRGKIREDCYTMSIWPFPLYFASSDWLEIGLSSEHRVQEFWISSAKVVFNCKGIIVSVVIFVTRKASQAVLFISQNHRITESQNSRGWKGPLWVT